MKKYLQLVVNNKILSSLKGLCKKIYTTISIVWKKRNLREKILLISLCLLIFSLLIYQGFEPSFGNKKSPTGAPPTGKSTASFFGATYNTITGLIMTLPNYRENLLKDVAQSEAVVVTRMYQLKAVQKLKETQNKIPISLDNLRLALEKNRLINNYNSDTDNKNKERNKIQIKSLKESYEVKVDGMTPADFISLITYLQQYGRIEGGEMLRTSDNHIQGTIKIH